MRAVAVRTSADGAPTHSDAPHRGASISVGCSLEGVGSGCDIRADLLEKEQQHRRKRLQRRREAALRRHSRLHLLAHSLAPCCAT